MYFERLPGSAISLHIRPEFQLPPEQRADMTDEEIAVLQEQYYGQLDEDRPGGVSGTIAWGSFLLQPGNP
jgi:hypothetical protein